MKKLRLLALLLVATVPFAACDDEGPEAPQTGGIQGTVVVEGTPLEGVNVAISGPESATATTDSNGQYSFQNVQAGSYTIEISGIPNDVTFGTVSKTEDISGGETATVDFSGDYIRTAVISGKVTAQTEDGEANVSGITVNLTGTEERTTQTDENGEFVFDGLRAGTYTVSIDAEGLEINFDQTSQQVQVSVGGSANVQFTGIRPEEAHVTINTVTTPAGANVNRQNVRGIIYVNVNVEPGTQNISRVSVALNDEEVASQDVSISSGSSSPAAAAPETVQFQINTAMFDPQTLEVRYPNGQYELSATVETADGGSSTATLGQPLVFNNVDILRVVHVDGNSLVSNGIRWYGGSDQDFRAEAILYSEQTEISEIGVRGFRPAAPIGTNGTAGIDLGSGAGNEHIISGPAPFEFTMAESANSPASPGVPGGVEDPGPPPGFNVGGMSRITITSVNDPDGVDIIGAFGAPAAFRAPFDFTAPVVNTPAASNLTVAAANPPAAPPTVINTAAAAAAAPGVFFSGGAFGLTNSSERGIGGPNFTFDVDDGATTTDPDFPDVSGIGDLSERVAANLTVEVTSITDNLSNAVDLSTNTVDGGNNTSAGFGVDKGAISVTQILPAAGQRIVLNPFDQDTPANTADNDMSFNASDPALADGNPGSGYNAGTADIDITDNSTGAVSNNNTPAPNAAGANTIETDGTGPFGAFATLDGDYTVTMTLTDMAIAWNTTVTVWNVVLDSTVPTTNMLNPPSANVTSSNNQLTFTISGDASDANGLSEVLVTVRNENAGDNDDVCELTDPLIATGTSAGQADRNSVDVTASASGFDVDIRINNNETNATDNDGENQDVCFFIESSDNAKDNNGNPEPNVSNQSARTQIDWRQ